MRIGCGISIFNDRSTDKSKDIILKWIDHFREKGVACVYSENKESTGGCGFAKNRCVEQSHGEYLCFQDADDVMYPDRIKAQMEVLRSNPTALVGTRFECVYDPYITLDENQTTACVTTPSG